MANGVLSSGAILGIAPGITDTKEVVFGGETLLVSSGATVSGTVINAGGSSVVLGTGSRTTVDTSGTEIIKSGGIAYFTTVSRGGAQIVSSGGDANNTTVGSAATIA